MHNLKVTKTFKNRKILLSYMEITKISSKGQIVLPVKMRNQLGIEEGSALAIEKIEDTIMIKKIDLNLINQFKKSLEDVKKGRIKRVA